MCASAVMVNGVTTWTYGYHSLRQICLGAIMVCTTDDCEREEFTDAV
jgi:hypothetical protein